MTNVHLM